MSFESFSERVLTHPSIATHPKYVPSKSLNPLHVPAVADQLIVSTRVQSAVETWLDRHSVHWKNLVSIPSRSDHAAVPGAVVFAVEFPLPHSAAPGGDIFSLVDELRIAVSDTNAKKLALVSPNHVLIPAPESWGCPHGAPTTTGNTNPGPYEAPAQPVYEIGVIDSGYQWNTQWGSDPLCLNGKCTLMYAPVLPPFTPVPPWPGPPGTWGPGIPDVSNAQWTSVPAHVSPDTVPVPPQSPYVLVALAGHANFVAGQIAKDTPPNTHITIVSHNGSFIDSATIEFPTEASVAWSLTLVAAAEVVNIGFAFPAYDNRPSSVWETVFTYLPANGVVVAPAGNQDSGVIPRFPGALNHVFGGFPQVKSVGSYSPPPVPANLAPTRSHWSNYGTWVDCAAVGEQVVSNFLYVKQELEDQAYPANVDFTANGMATWQGTSFAAPKVTAAVATDQINGGLNAGGGGWATLPNAAWGNIYGAATAAPGLQIGNLIGA